jgi:cardiolipin synthase A/B
MARVGRMPLATDTPFERAAGAALVPGNRVRLLRDAGENYPAWAEAIRAAERTIDFESYIVHDDDIGREFAGLLADRARAGVRVRLVYDWVGALGKASRRLWRSLREAGVEVRCFNPPRLDSPLGWLSRDHRKMIAVDGQVGFVTGLCVGQRWKGWPERGIEPWRDTGVEVRGPAVADIERAFVRVWAATGEPLPEGELERNAAAHPAGGVRVRVIATEPYMGSLYRLDQLVAATARRTIWLTDAYFVGTTSYVQALKAAAMDGVDVRLLVPHASDLPLVAAISRTGYRTLLEAGVRIFEWNGPMLHAKTAVVDGRWSRVGSSNLNLASWIGNWELDVVVEDEPFAAEMEAMYLDDLARSTEVRLTAARRPRPADGRRAARVRGERGSAQRAVAGALTLGRTVGAAITNTRLLDRDESTIAAHAAIILFGVAVVAAAWPAAVAWPLALLAGWLAASLFVRAYRLRTGRPQTGAAPADPRSPPRDIAAAGPEREEAAPRRRGLGP